MAPEIAAETRGGDAAEALEEKGQEAVVLCGKIYWEHEDEDAGKLHWGAVPSNEAIAVETFKNFVATSLGLEAIDLNIALDHNVLRPWDTVAPGTTVVVFRCWRFVVDLMFSDETIGGGRSTRLARPRPFRLEEVLYHVHATVGPQVRLLVCGEPLALGDLARDRLEIHVKRSHELGVHTLIYHAGCRPGEALGDSGCRTSVGGAAWHQQLRAEVERRGYRVRSALYKEYFKFGAGPVVASERLWVYPIGFHGKNELLRIAEVPGNCPGLLSIEDMSRLKVAFDFEARVLTVRGQRHPMTYTTSGHPTLYLLDYDPTADPDDVWGGMGIWWDAYAMLDNLANEESGNGQTAESTSEKVADSQEELNEDDGYESLDVGETAADT